MTRTVAVPLWLLILILLFAGASFLLHFLFPSVRWFFRQRAQRAVARLNTRLKRPIEPFKLARRYDMIQRLIYDPAVTRAVAEEAREQGIPENVAWERARAYAREIVPAFSATLYFTVGTRLARWLSRSLYRIRLPEIDLAALDRLPADATVVFVMNHRSNMDYVLVTWLVSPNGALSYAVGEWARVWPLSGLIRMMGAFFIRRRERGTLYRRVLARYVQMATEGGVTQAIFPEGRLSVSGRMGEPRFGLLSYIIDGAEARAREVVFVPVGINYDRVIEDRFLIRAHVTGVRRFRPPLSEVLGAVGHHAWARVTGRFRSFGTAKVSVGEPLPLSEFLSCGPDRPAERLAEELMARVAAVIPAVPVALVARHLLDGEAWSREALEAAVRGDLDVLETLGGDLPGRGAGKIVDDALGLLGDRGVILLGGGTVRRRPEERDLFAYYAGSLAHVFGKADAGGN
jgi:glycerol-3-phosphate O-acyltransferase